MWIYFFTKLRHFKLSTIFQLSLIYRIYFIVRSTSFLSTASYTNKDTSRKQIVDEEPKPRVEGNEWFSRVECVWPGSDTTRKLRCQIRRGKPTVSLSLSLSLFLSFPSLTLSEVVKVFWLFTLRQVKP